jgi:conjugative transfer signal peptidase TraF
MAASAENRAMRSRTATILMTFTAVALVLSTMGEATPAYIWNASKSVPVGLYELQPAGGLAVTELVAVRPPEPLATFLDLNGYLPIGVPMLKRVLALPGQTVCRKGLTISVDGIDMGDALSRDSRGRPLPAWQGCRVVGANELFLMNWQSEDSLDGRYFGFVPNSSVIGKALPVWTGEE